MLDCGSWPPHDSGFAVFGHLPPPFFLLHEVDQSHSLPFRNFVHFSLGSGSKTRLAPLSGPASNGSLPVLTPAVWIHPPSTQRMQSPGVPPPAGFSTLGWNDEQPIVRLTNTVAPCPFLLPATYAEGRSFHLSRGHQYPHRHIEPALVCAAFLPLPFSPFFACLFGIRSLVLVAPRSGRRILLGLPRLPQ